jgi:hypothetical protein
MANKKAKDKDEKVSRRTTRQMLPLILALKVLQEEISRVAEETR